VENVRPINRDTADNNGLNHTPPHDIEAEEMVLGAVMHYPQAYADAQLLIDRTDLFQPAHQLIWDTVGQLLTESQGVHPVAVRARIERDGRLREVDGGMLIHRLAGEHIAAGMVGHFAQIIADRAHERRYDEHATELKAAIGRKASGDELDELVSAFQQRETLRANTGHGPAHLTAALLDWDVFFATDFGAIELLPGRLMAPGQQITIVGDGKAGKSLFVQEWMWRMATGQSFLGDKPGDPVTILYLDAENGQEQVQERFISFGGGFGRMGTLRYASFPPVRPLDTAGGGADLMALVKATGAQLVVIDTVSRFISGPENDADTWLNLYRHTLLPMKRDRISGVRLDHLGKDGDRGARGSSAKTQDVDHVWTLQAQGGGVLALRRTHTRTGIGPDDFTLRRDARRDGDNWVPGATRHVIVTFDHDLERIPGTVEYIVHALDKAGLPNDAGNPKSRAALAELQIPARKERIEDAVRRRKARALEGSSPEPREVPPHLPHDLGPGGSPGESPNDHGGTTKPQVKHSPGTPGEPVGNPPSPPSSPHVVGEGGGGRGTKGENTGPHCTICTHPIHGYRAERGYDTCLSCDPHTGSHPPTKTTEED